MNWRKTAPIAMFAVGFILVSMGMAASYVRAQETSACDACGMEIKKTDPTVFTIRTADGAEHYGCCPVCALSMAIYYDNTAVTTECATCGESIEITIRNQTITGYKPNDVQHNVSMVFGKACLSNRMVCSGACAETLKTTNTGMAEFPVKTLQETYSMAKAKIPTLSINTKNIQTPTVTLAVFGTGGALIILAPVLWLLLNRRK